MSRAVTPRDRDPWHMWPWRRMEGDGGECPRYPSHCSEEAQLSNTTVAGPEAEPAA